jgi:hypothetical protein
MNPLFKTFMYYLLASTLVVLAQPYLYQGLMLLDHFYESISQMLAPIFNQVGLGSLVHRGLVLILIPMLLVAPFALIYQLIQKRSFPWTFQLIWAFWMILVLTSILIR